MSDDKTKPSTLIVVVAFDVDERTGVLQQVYGPAEQDSDEQAIQLAESLASQHAGVLAWSRIVNPEIGEYGDSKVLFQSGSVPKLE